jgi:hypothetical protein
MSAEVNWDDVAAFVSEYIADNDRGPGTGDLLEDIAQAYVMERGLPPNAVVTVVQMVDSVL